MSVTVAVHDGLFSIGDDPRLLGSACSDCGGHHFPRHDICPYCGGERVTPTALSPTGTLWSWTAVTAAPPGYLGAVPYGFGVVELPEGVRVITRLTESDPARLTLGQPMHLVTEPLGTDDDGATVVTYAFAPGPA